MEGGGSSQPLFASLGLAADKSQDIRLTFPTWIHVAFAHNIICSEGFLIYLENYHIDTSGYVNEKSSVDIDKTK